MGFFPKIQSRCPYESNLDEIMDGDICRSCKKPVYDLTDMTDDERFSFMRNCSDDACVSYSFLRPVAALAAASVATVSFACPPEHKTISSNPYSHTSSHRRHTKAAPDIVVTSVPRIEMQRTAGIPVAPAARSDPENWVQHPEAARNPEPSNTDKSKTETKAAPQE